MLREPQRFFSLDPELNRRSAERLAELEPRLIVFRSWPAAERPGKLRRFVDRFPGRV